VGHQLSAATWHKKKKGTRKKEDFLQRCLQAATLQVTPAAKGMQLAREGGRPTKPYPSRASAHPLSVLPECETRTMEL
jgi:hypothetical protein